MAKVLLFHHAQGLTPGIVAFADTLRGAGHVVHTPDLFEGRTFGTLEEGMSYVGDVGFGKMVERGVQAAEGMPAELVYAGFSLGVLPAQMLAQTRAGARGALLFYACVPLVQGTAQLASMSIDANSDIRYSRRPDASSVDISPPVRAAFAKGKRNHHDSFRRTAYR
jgi:hypothetical protein